MYTVSWTLILAVFWLLLSGFLQPLLLAFGVVSVALTVYLMLRMDRLGGHQQSFNFSFIYLRYLLWLMWQIALSSGKVVKLIWVKQYGISPAIEKLPLNEVSKRKRVLFANSITLTPGTLCVDIDEEYVTVHALRAKSLRTMAKGEMAKEVSKTSGEKE